MDQMQATIDALRLSLANVTTEVVSLRTSANASANAVASLTATSNTAWDRHAARMDQIESDVADVQGRARRQGGGGGDGNRPREWDLLHKGDLKEFSGDKKLYRPWTTQFQVFCNTKRPGFRKALLWAAKLKGPITQAELAGTQWEHTSGSPRHRIWRP